MSNIEEISKHMASYLGWSYITNPENSTKDVPFKFPKLGWWNTRCYHEHMSKYICRKHHELRFFNSTDTLMLVVNLAENQEDWEISWGKNWCSIFNNKTGELLNREFQCAPDMSRQVRLFYSLAEALEFI